MRCIKPRDRKHIKYKVALTLALARVLVRVLALALALVLALVLALAIALAIVLALVLARGVISPLIHIEGSSALFSREAPVTSQVHLQRGWSTLSFYTYRI